MAGLSGEPLLSAVPQLDELRAQFESLDLPRASARELRQRFSHASDRCAEALRRHRAAAVRRGWTDALGVAPRSASTHSRPCRDVAGRVRGTAGGRSVCGRRPRPPSEGTAQHPRATARSRRRRHGQPRRGRERGGVATAVIRAELISGVPTPPEDLELRREHQYDASSSRWATATRHPGCARRSRARMGRDGASRVGCPRCITGPLRALSHRQMTIDYEPITPPGRLGTPRVNATIPPVEKPTQRAGHHVRPADSSPRSGVTATGPPRSRTSIGSRPQGGLRYRLHATVRCALPGVIA